MCSLMLLCVTLHSADTSGVIYNRTEKRPALIDVCLHIHLNSHVLLTQTQRKSHGICSYQPGTTVLCYEDESASSPNQPTSLQILFRPPGDTEGSSNSEESHETGDSGRYSHDEMELTNLSSGLSSRPPSLRAEESGESDSSPARESEGELGERCHLELEMGDSMEKARLHYQAPDNSQPALSL